MWLLHHVVTAGWLLDLIVTGIGGALVYALSYLAVGLTEEERNGALKLIGRVKAR